MDARKAKQPAQTRDGAAAIAVAVHIVGAPIACAKGVKDTWREVAAWVAGQLAGRYGKAVSVCYFDLFDPACPPVSENAQLPLVFVNGEVFSSGGKISVPALRARLEALGVGTDIRS
jgi:hypothetical protein